MAVYPDSVKVWANLGGVWTDISEDVNSNLQAQWGIFGNTPVDRMADTGTLTFTLNNVTGKYTPGQLGSIAGWGKGVEIKLEISFDSKDYIRFIGRVADVDVDSGTYGKRDAQVTVVDWLDYTANYPLASLTIEANRRGDYALGRIVAGLPIPPASTEYATGESIFPAIFDTTPYQAKAASEINKVVLSELGYCYLTKDRWTGETLVFEAATSRPGYKPLSNVPIGAALSGFLLKEDGDYLLKEDGDNILLDERQAAVFDNTMQQLDVTYGDNVRNQIRIRAYPKRVDTSDQVLFALESPLLVPSGVTTKITGTFRDPASKQQICGINMVAPVATTDYLCNTVSDGSGTNITASVTVTATYSANSVTYIIYNANTQAGYMTRLQSRGRGIYPYNPIEAIAEDAASISQYGYHTTTLDQKYQNTLDKGLVASQVVLQRNKEPRSVLEEIHLIANNSDALMQAFLTLDVGSKIHIKETQAGIDGHYYIQGMNYDISLGGVIRYSWRLSEEAPSLQKGLKPAAIRIEAAAPQVVQYGYLPRLVNLSRRTYTAWIYPFNLALFRYIIGLYSAYAANYLFIGDTGKIMMQTAYDAYFGASGIWTSGVDYTPNAWQMVAVSWDISANDKAAPVFYKNGMRYPGTVVLTPTGNRVNETGAALVLGNSNISVASNPLAGWIKDARVYSRILEDGEIMDLYNGLEVTSGLIFQGPCVDEKLVSQYHTALLTEDQKLLDNAYGAAGTPLGGPLCEII